MNNFKIIADFDFWVKFEKWNIEQMTTLFLGYDPLYFDKAYRDKLSNGDVETTLTDIDIEIILEEHGKMNALIVNSIKSGSLKFETTPIKCYQWALLKNIPVFEQFKTAIQNIKRDSPLNEIVNEDNGKRKQQLYKIILSLAIKYKFNPDNLKNPSTSKFKNAIERAGLNIDDNTIREVVRTSYDLYKDKIDHAVFEN